MFEAGEEFDSGKLFKWLTDLDGHKKKLVQYLMGIKEEEVVINGKRKKVPISDSKPILTKEELDKLLPIFEAATSKILMFSNLDYKVGAQLIKEVLLAIYNTLLNIQLERSVTRKKLVYFRLNEEKLKHVTTVEQAIELQDEEAPPLLDSEIEMCYKIFELAILSIFSRAVNGSELNRWKPSSTQPTDFGFDFGEETQKEEFS